MSWRRLGIQLVLFAGSWGALAYTAKRLYDAMLPGVPDQFRAELALLPWLLSPEPGYPWVSFEYFIVWALAVLMFLVPILLVTLVASSLPERLTALLLSVGLASWGVFVVFRRQHSYIEVFQVPRTTFERIRFVAVPVLWIVGICALGAVLGVFANVAVRRIGKRKTDGADGSGAS